MAGGRFYWNVAKWMAGFFRGGNISFSIFPDSRRHQIGTHQDSNVDVAKLSR